MPETNAAVTQAAGSGMAELLGLDPIAFAWIVVGMAGFLWLLLVVAALMTLSIRKQSKQINAGIDQLRTEMQHLAKWQEYSGSKAEQLSDQLVMLHKMVEERASASRKASQAQAVQLGKLIHQQTDQLTELLRR